MTKPSQDAIFQIVDGILSEMPLGKKVFLASMKKEDVDVLQAVFDLYIRDKIDPEDKEYENIILEL